MTRSILILVAGILVFSFAILRLMEARDHAARQETIQPETPASANLRIPPRPRDPVVTVTVSGLNYIFSPPDLSVSVGTSVTWKSETASPHTITSVVPHLFDNALPAYGQTTIRFTHSGTYPYYCALHPYMLGTITVH